MTGANAPLKPSSLGRPTRSAVGRPDLSEHRNLRLGRDLEGLVGSEGFAVDASLIKAEANRERSVPGDPGLPPEVSSRAIDEYLAMLDDAAFGAATPVTPKFISPVNPAARWTAARKGPAFFAYATNYLIDLKHAVIVDVEVSSTACHRVLRSPLGERRSMRTGVCLTFDPR